MDEDRLIGRILKRLRRRYNFLRLNKKWRVKDDVVLEVDEAKSRLQACLEEFRREKRCVKLELTETVPKADGVLDISSLVCIGQPLIQTIQAHRQERTHLRIATFSNAIFTSTTSSSS